MLEPAPPPPDVADIRGPLVVAPPRSAWQRFFRLALKELRETLRDRRTTITLVLMPLMIYPLLGLIFQKLAVSQLAPAEKLTLMLGFTGAEDQQAFFELYTRALREEQRQTAKPAPAATSSSGSNNANNAASSNKADRSSEFQWKPIPESQLEEAVRQRIVDLSIRRQQSAEGIEEFELITDLDAPLSVEAGRVVEKRMRQANEALLRRIELPPALKQGLVLPRERIVQVPSGAGGRPLVSLAALVPLILILMTLTGAVYPAIDLTAGERERGTLEPLIAAPISRSLILAAKYVAVVSVAMLTAIVNLLAMTITAYSTGLERVVFGQTGLTWSAISLVLCLLILFASFFSAVTLALTSYARSFKEAQAYLIPVMLVSIAPGVLSLMPNVELHAGLAVTPLVNMVLLTRDLFSGEAQWTPLLLTLVSTSLYTGLALWTAGKIFGADALLFGGGGGWTDLFHVATRVRPAAQLATATLCLCVILSLLVILSGTVGRQADLPMLVRLLVNSVITLGLFVGIPLLFARQEHVQLSSAFGWRRAGLLTLAGSLILGLSLWAIVIELKLTMSPVVDQFSRFADQIRRYQQELAAVPLSVKLIALAIIPAVSEELFFRGYFYSAVRSRTSPFITVLITGILFGAFHVVVMDLLAFERFVPTTLLGIILGLVRSRTGSLYPGILLHVMHNSLLLSLAHFESTLTRWGIGIEEARHLPASWILGSLFFVAVGTMLLLAGSRPPRSLPTLADASGA